MAKRISHGISIIKKRQVKVGDPKKINMVEECRAAKENSIVSPIKENDQVVGFLFECSCGEKARVMLEFDDEKKD